MKDAMTVAFDIPSYDFRYRWKFIPHLFTIWHVDTCKDGTDDSCGWFKRSRHGDQNKLERIVSRFDFDWDRVFDPNQRDDDSDFGGISSGIRPLVYTGLFRPEDGQPNLSPIAITTTLFHHAAGIHFDKSGDSFNWKAANKFVKTYLAEIIQFAENPGDSLVDAIIRRHAVNCGERYKPSMRKDRIREFASIIYGWILRADTPWHKHPRWHFWHWKIEFHPWRNLVRRYWTKCCVCGKRGFKDSAIGSWDGSKIWHSSCDTNLFVNKEQSCHQSKN